MIEHSFGETVKQLRLKRSLTLREVALVLQIDTSMLSKVEKNLRRPTKAMIERFAKLFNVSDKDLTISFLSDSVVYQVLDDADMAHEILHVADMKIQYLMKNQKQTK